MSAVLSAERTRAACAARRRDRPTLAAGRPAAHRAAMARDDLLAMASTMVPFGVALGVTTASMHAGSAAGVAGGGLLYAGTAQLSALLMVQGGAGVLAVLASAAIVNSRLLLYGAALEPAFRHQPRWFRLLGVHLIVDGTYVAAVGRPHLLHEPAEFRSYWLRLGVPLLALWTGSVTLGVLLGPVMPSMPHLGLVGLGLFVSMLVPRLTGAPALAAAAAAATVGLLGTLFLPGLGIIAGAVAGIAAGTLADRRSS